MAHLLSAKHCAGALRLAALLAVPVMFGAAASPAWSFDVVYAESNSTAGNSILSFENDGSGALRFLGSTPAGGIGVFDSSFALGPFDSDQISWSAAIEAFCSPSIPAPTRLPRSASTAVAA